MPGVRGSSERDGTAAAAVLRRILPSVEERAVELVPLCRRVVESADGSGRALFSANRDLEDTR